MMLRKDKWLRVILGEICDVRDGTHDSPKYQKEGYPLITSKNITGGFIDFSEINRISENDYIQINKRSFVDNGDILLSMIGTVGIPVLVEKETDFAIKNVSLIKFNNKPETIYNKYLLSVLQSDGLQKKIQAKTSGTAQKFISLGLIRGLELPLPPLEEQKQIAALFQSIEEAVERVEEQEKNLHFLLQNLINEIVKDDSKNRKDKLRRISFGAIAVNISERIEPKEAIGQIFVGLDHIDSREVSIERFGKPDSLIGTKLKVYDGDIIFGKRNAYLRKAAIANFNGICSAHAMVIRANEKNILKDYLPFFMHSDSFMLRAKEISEGSISPTIKWKNLEKQEFLIPEMEEQKKFTEIFKQIEEIRLRLKQQKTTLKNLKQKLLSEILG